jgi:hypothetical protein
VAAPRPSSSRAAARATFCGRVGRAPLKAGSPLWALAPLCGVAVSIDRGSRMGWFTGLLLPVGLHLSPRKTLVLQGQNRRPGGGGPRQGCRDGEGVERGSSRPWAIVEWARVVIRLADLRIGSLAGTVRSPGGRARSPRVRICGKPI